MYVLLSFALIPFCVFAHSSGTSYEADVGEYHVDVGYDPPEIYSGDRIVFDFGTFTTIERDPVEFDYVWVRIRDAERTLLATGIAKAEFGPTSLLFVLPDDVVGELTVSVRYQQDGETLAETEFPLTVFSNKSLFQIPFLLSLAAAGIGGAGLSAGISFILMRKRR